MNKNAEMLRKIGGLGLAGAMVFGAAQTQAEPFSVTTTVQNTLAVTNVQDMNLGTLFAASANSSAVSSLVLTPAGSFNQPQQVGLNAVDASFAPPFLSLGGEAAARASVATGEDFTVVLPSGIQSSDLSDPSDFTDGAGSAVALGNVVELRIGGTAGDPNVARFYMADFTVGDATIPNTDFAPNGTNPNEIDFTPDFGVENVEFGIGATVYTDGSGERTEYEAGTYEGSFEVTAEF